MNASGLVSLVGRYYPIGYHLAGQLVTLRLQGNVMAVLVGNKLLRSLPCIVPASDRASIRGARPATPCEPLTSRRVKRTALKAQQGYGASPVLWRVQAIRCIVQANYRPSHGYSLRKPREIRQTSTDHE